MYLFCLFGLRLYVSVNNFSVLSGRIHRFQGITSTFGEVNVSCSRIQHGDPNEDRTPDLSLRYPTLYHYAAAPPLFTPVLSTKSILCKMAVDRECYIRLSTEDTCDLTVDRDQTTNLVQQLQQMQEKPSPIVHLRYCVGAAKLVFSDEVNEVYFLNNRHTFSHGTISGKMHIIT